MKRRVAGFLLLGMGAALTVIMAVSVFLTVQRNNTLLTSEWTPSGFVQNESLRDYQKKVPLPEMDLTQYDFVFSQAFGGVGLLKTTFTLTHPISYYQEIDGKKREVYTIAAGTTVDAGDYQSVYDALGYGFNGYPTYERGWRWVRAFPLEGEGFREDALWYYCKTADLEKAAADLLHESGAMQHNLQLLKERDGMSQKEFLHHFVCRVDSFFYMRGVYLSPDYLYPLWTWGHTALSAVIGLVLISGVRFLKRTTTQKS
ncbi:MAG: hypothetical protein J1E06_04930 [Acutalibacter sp.]|nr:hypothetical protein [Acutalibacter sp.]